MAMLRSFLLLFIIFSVGNASVIKSQRCPTGWKHFGLQCYKYFSQSADWITAERNCNGLGGNLASVRNKVEHGFLMSLLPSSSTRAWVGGHDGVEDGQWLWSDGTAFLYSKWCSGEPNNSARPEDCLEINFLSNSCWNDAPCSIPKSYLCVRDL